jgi:hypothetical protein
VRSYGLQAGDAEGAAVMTEQQRRARAQALRQARHDLDMARAYRLTGYRADAAIALDLAASMRRMVQA